MNVRRRVISFALWSLITARKEQVTLLLRITDPKSRSFYGDFKWPTQGLVIAPSWNDDPNSFTGLHAFTSSQYFGTRNCFFPFEAKAHLFHLIACSPLDVVSRENTEGTKFRRGWVVDCFHDRELACRSWLNAELYLRVVGLLSPKF